MYDFMNDLLSRPAPFLRYTAKALWTRPHLSRQMLKFHLNQETDLASRRIEVIDDTVNWLDRRLDLNNKRLCDLGCGPGLYTERFASRGAQVTGVDFSEYAMNHALKSSNGDTRYLVADYLDDPLPTGFDLITLIYTDLCVLSPQQRAHLLQRLHDMLNPNGHIVLDVAGPGLLQGRQETLRMEKRLMDGFWASGDYVGIQASFIYHDLMLALDRYVIIEPGETWDIFNWFQHFTPQMIEIELNDAGFDIVEMSGDLCGGALKPDGNLLGIIATPC